MKKTVVWLITLFMFCFMTTFAFAAGTNTSDKEQAKIAKQQAKIAKEKAKIAKEKKEINELSVKALENLYEKVPAAKRIIPNAYAYATLSNTGMKLGILGDAHGRGLAVNNVTGEKVYMRMKETGIGLGLGIKEYDLIFVISTEKAWNSFISGDIKFASSAEASARDGKTGESVEGASIAANGVWVYQMTKKGLTLEASIKGTKIYPYKKLNENKK